MIQQQIVCVRLCWHLIFTLNCRSQCVDISMSARSLRSSRHSVSPSLWRFLGFIQYLLRTEYLPDFSGKLIENLKFLLQILAFIYIYFRLFLELCNSSQVDSQNLT